MSETGIILRNGAEDVIRAHHGEAHAAAAALGLTIREYRDMLRRHTGLAEVAAECRRAQFETIRSKILNAAASGDMLAAALAVKSLSPDQDRGAGVVEVPDFSRDVHAARDCTDLELEALCRRRLDDLRAAGVCPHCGSRVTAEEYGQPCAPADAAGLVPVSTPPAPPVAVEAQGTGEGVKA